MSDMTEHYEIVNNPNMREMSSVKLLKGAYKGVTYNYGELKFIKVQGEPVCKYIFEVTKNPNKLDLENDKQFKILISEILDEILKVAFTPDPWASAETLRLK